MSPRKLATLAFVAAAAACRLPPGEPPPGVNKDGKSSFESAVPGTGGQGGGARNAAGAPGAPEATFAGDAGGQQRQVEEADVVRLDGNTLYVLNAYRGLMAIDLTDPDAPILLGRSPVFGHPVEMYVRDGVAYIVVSNYFDYWAAEGDAAEGFQGSEIRVVDVRNPAAPVLVGSYKVEGYVSDTRIVGDVLYVVSNRYAWYDYFASQDTESATHVRSINLADPRAPYEVERLKFPGTSNNVHPTSELLYVAQPVEGRDWFNQATRFTVLDIADPEGHISVKSTFDTAGALGFWNVSQEMARFQMDQYGNFFRVITHTGSNGQDGAQILTVYDVSNPAAPEKISELGIPNSGGLWATRFDGDRVYCVTLVQKDPLEVILLTNPYKPVLVRQLEIPGLLRLVMPVTSRMGQKRLIALATDQAWGGGVGLALFDVDDPANTHELDRAMLGAGGWAYSNAIWDDKAIRIVDRCSNTSLVGCEDLGLLPFNGSFPDGTSTETGEKGETSWRWVNGLAIVGIDLDGGALTAHGVVEHYGQIQRAFPKDARLVAFSDTLLQTIDATDLDHPKVKAALTLARDIADFGVTEVTAGTGTKFGVQYVNADWWAQGAASKLRTVPLSDPDGERNHFDEVELDVAWGRLWTQGAFAYVTGSTRDTGQNELLVFEVGADGHLHARGKVEIKLAENEWWYWGNGGAALVDGPALAIATSRWIETGIPTPWGGFQWRNVRSVYSIDLRDPASPVLGSKVELPGESYAELVPHGAQVLTSHYEWLRTEIDGRTVGKWFVDRVDLSDPRAPKLLAGVNVPGTFADISGDGKLLYTVDYQYQQDPNDQWQVSNTLNVLWLAGDLAVLQDSEAVPERIDRLKANGRAIYAATQPWWWDTTAQRVNPYWWRESTLRVFDAQAPTDTREVKAIALDGNFGIREMLGGRLFLTLGGGGWWWGWSGGGGGVAGRAGAPVGDACFDCGGMYYGGGGQGLLVYNVARELSPSFLGFFRTFGWVNTIAVAGDKAFLASGMYGMQTVPLDQAF